MFSLIRRIIRRAREERLAQVAASLAFTTVLSIVPLMFVSFALFTHFPIFERFESALRDYLLTGLLPVDMSRTILGYVGQFAANTRSLTVAGSLFLLVAAMTMLYIVEDAFNQIWGVKQGRPFLKRIALHLLMLAVVPPLLGASLWATSYVLSASMGLIGSIPSSLEFSLDLGPMLLSVFGFATLFYFVPYTTVRGRHAIMGGLIAGVAFECGKRGFAIYLLKFATYKAVYGALAAFPVFLLWVYFSWLVTLTSALVTANLRASLPQTGVQPFRSRFARRMLRTRSARSRA